MNISHVPVLADAIKAYYEDTKELIDLCELVDLDLDFGGAEIDFSYVKFSRLLVTQMEHDNRRRFLETIVPSLLNRAREGAAHSKWDAQEFHRRAEGCQIEVRQHPKLHDRFILFNGRCWLIGSSLKDAGKKIMNIIECVDIRDKLLSEVESKWTEGSKDIL